METTVTLDKKHFQAAAKKARKLGSTQETYIESLIDADTMTFDQILAPARKGFAKRGTTEEELDEVVKESRKAVQGQLRRKTRT